jgi:DNA mismatch repair protein MutS
MVEMEETATILHHATQHSLVILDEIGRGTSTYDGIAIARAVVEHLHNSTRARTLFATHYHELSSMTGELAHLGVYTMAISDNEQGGIVFLHRVVTGAIGRSYGVYVARLAGMPPHIVKRAEDVLYQLEHSKGSEQAAPAWEKRLLAEQQGEYVANGYHNNVSEAYRFYEWQSEEARQAAAVLERADEEEPDMRWLDLSSITPLDALNLLFLLQKKRR